MCRPGTPFTFNHKALPFRRATHSTFNRGSFCQSVLRSVGVVAIASWQFGINPQTPFPPSPLEKIQRPKQTDRRYTSSITSRTFHSYSLLLRPYDSSSFVVTCKNTSSNGLKFTCTSAIPRRTRHSSRRANKSGRRRFSSQGTTKCSYEP